MFFQKHISNAPILKGEDGDESSANETSKDAEDESFNISFDISSDEEEIESSFDENEEDLSKLAGRRYIRTGVKGIAQLSDKLMDESNAENDIPILKYFADLKIKNAFSFEFIGGLLNGEADVNMCDEYGQTLLHEVAREWHTDVAQFLYNRRINIHRSDRYGRTPLMVASASDNDHMVKWLLQHGAQVSVKCKRPEQYEAIHYAAAFDAPKSLAALIQFGVHPDKRNAFQETPLFIAANNGSVRVCKYLLEKELPVGTYTSYGATPLEMICAKMPLDIAIKALDQCFLACQNSNMIYLSSLTKKRWRNLSEINNLRMEKPTTRPVLETIVEKNDFGLIEHHVIQEYIKQMSQVFGDFHIKMNLLFNILYTIVWTVECSLLNLNKEEESLIRTVKMVFTFIGLLMTAVLTMKLKWEYNADHEMWKKYHVASEQALMRRFDHCHPSWEKEKILLIKEMEQKEDDKPLFWSDGWVWIKIVTLLASYFHVLVNIIWFVHPVQLNKSINVYYNVFFLVIVWLHLNRSLVFSPSIGPFITILAYSVKAVVQFAFLFAEFFIPFVCGFYVMFGGLRKPPPEGGKYEITGEYQYFNDVIYQLYLLTNVSDYVIDDLLAIDKVFAEFFIFIYFILVSIICMNIYIALLTQVFADSISSAVAVSSLSKTRSMLMLTWVLPSLHVNMETHLAKHCSPLQKPLKYNDDDSLEEEPSISDVLNNASVELKRLTKQMKEYTETQHTIHKDLDFSIKQFEMFMKKNPTSKVRKLTREAKAMNEYLSSYWYDVGHRVGKFMKTRKS